MNTDAFFAIGHTHTVCQDYATRGPDFAVLSDGCSRSPHVDFGARLLCRMAGLHGAMDAVDHALPLLEPLGLPLDSLNATILIARWDAERKVTAATIQGDGVIVARRRDGSVVTIVSTFPSGAPRYPGYRIGDRMAAYEQEWGGLQTITMFDGDKPPFVETIESAVGAYELNTYEFDAATFDLVLLLSDGVLSFTRPHPTNPSAPELVPLEEVLPEILDIKTFGGVFLIRRMRRMLEAAAKKGWKHDDDLAVAGVYMGAS